MAEEKDAKAIIARYLALSYGYGKVAYEQPKPGSANVLSPEEEEFVMADQSLEEACLATRPGAELIQSIADEEVFTIFERKVGGWTHRFCSRFKRCQVTGALEVEQFTEVVAPPPLPQMALKFPLNKELGEAGCLFQSALVLCGLLADPDNVLHAYTNSTMHVVEVGSGTGALGIAAAMLGCTVTMTDLPHVIPQGEMSEIGFSACTKFHQNDSLDARTERITCAPLAWGDMEQSGAISKADLVLCSDCLYREETHHLLLETLRLLCHEHTLIVVSLEIRRFPVEDNFFEAAGDLFSLEPLAVSMDDDRDVRVWLLRLK